MSQKEKFVIIDGNAILHRAYHALPPFTTKEGIQVNAVYGFASMLLKILDTIKPKYLAVSFDVAKKTFRDDLYKEYKATRVKGDQELYDQIPLVYKVVEAFDIPIYKKAGFEADDVIGTIAKELSRDWDGEVIIASGDKDLLQLVDKNIHVYLLRKGITDVEMFGEKEVKEKFGFEPKMMVDFKSLKGDPSDNIPGVKGIGDKGANELINKVGKLEEIYKQIDSLEEKGISKRTVKLLREDKEMAFLSKKLATIVTDVEGLNFKIKDAETKTIDVEEIVKLFNDFGFNSLIKRAFDMFGGEENKSLKTEEKNEKREITKVIIEDVEKIVSKLKKEKEFFCKEILADEDILENKLIGFVCGTNKEIYFFDFRAFEDTQKKMFFSLFSNNNLLLGHNLKQLVKVLLINKISNPICNVPKMSFGNMPLDGGHLLLSDQEKKEFILSKQILRSGTAVAALVREAEYGQSKADFINKLSVGLKEANETAYWLSLLKDTDYIRQDEFLSISVDCTELIKILTASIKTAKNKSI